jgi:hypothetical protein
MFVENVVKVALFSGRFLKLEDRLQVLTHDFLVVSERRLAAGVLQIQQVVVVAVGRGALATPGAR